MKLDAPINNNYCATVVKLKAIVPLANCDNVVGTPLFGFQAIVSKDHQVGDVGIVFPAETQLSEEYCYENNLHRHDDKNKNLGVKGYLEDNRRIKALKFRGQRSDCLFMSLESLKYTGVKIEELKEGDEFDTLGNKAICQKYVIRTRESFNRLTKNAKKVFKRVEEKFLPEHYDSDNFFKYSGELDPETEIIVTQKLHGTSVRIANTIVKRKLSLVEHVFKKVGFKIAETDFDYVYGSRKVIKDINNPNQQHFYEIDIWSAEGKKLDGMIPQNFIVYGELIGWTPSNAALQKDYTYNVPLGEAHLYVYRIAFVNHQGKIVDLAWHHVKEMCTELGLKHVPELWQGKLKEFDVNQFVDRRFYDEGHVQCLPLSDSKLVDEGVCVRVDRIAPYILKAKGPLFYEHETKILDTGEVDLETQGSEVA